ncbi:hypothetical protein KAX75_06170 [candidate division WOR-3 bacterium]|nr:hypothetical protein [candidate division WOR-3 bacterium]
MVKRIKLNGEEIKLTIKDLCHKGDFGNYKITIEKNITFDLDLMSKKLQKEFKIDKLHKLFMIIKKTPISISIARHGKIMIEKVDPDTPEKALEIAKTILETIPGYEGIV